MDPTQNNASAATTAQATGTTDADVQAQFDQVLGSLVQGFMSQVMEELQQTAMEGDDG